MVPDLQLTGMTKRKMVDPWTRARDYMYIEDRGWRTPCWIFFGTHSGAGYGQLSVGSLTDGTKRMAYMHRLAYEKFVGPIPEGLTLDHLCRVRNCCNPDHLEPVTSGENVRRSDPGARGRAQQLAKTHCPQGHEYAGENLYLYKGERHCKTCKKERQRARCS